MARISCWPQLSRQESASIEAAGRFARRAVGRQVNRWEPDGLCSSGNAFLIRFGDVPILVRMSRRPPTARVPRGSYALVLVALLAGACQAEVAGTNVATNSVGGGAGTSTGGAANSSGAGTTPTSAEFAPAPGGFKRLTDTEFRNSVRDLLGDVQMGDLEPDTFIDGFAKVGSAEVAISFNGVEKYELALEAATRRVFDDAARRSSLLGCTPTARLRHVVHQLGQNSRRQRLAGVARWQSGRRVSGQSTCAQRRRKPEPRAVQHRQHHGRSRHSIGRRRRLGLDWRRRPYLTTSGGLGACRAEA